MFLRFGFTDFQAYFKIVGLYLFLYFLVLSRLVIHFFFIRFIVIFNFSVVVNWIKQSKMEYKNNLSSTSEELPSNGTYLSHFSLSSILEIFHLRQVIAIFRII